MVTAALLQAQQIQPAQTNIIPAKLEIGTIQAFLGVAAVLIGIGVAWGTLRTLVKEIQRTLTDEIKPDIKNVRERFIVVEERVDTIWKDRFAPSHSPRQLNDRGTEVLIQSGIKEIIEGEKDHLLALVKQKNATNAYDAEQAILDIVMELPKHCPDMVDKLKAGAFKTGSGINALLFVGGIHLRNLIFSDLGFSLTDIDVKKK